MQQYNFVNFSLHDYSWTGSNIFYDNDKRKYKKSEPGLKGAYHATRTKRAKDNLRNFTFTYDSWTIDIMF